MAVSVGAFALGRLRGACPSARTLGTGPHLAAPASRAGKGPLPAPVRQEHGGACGHEADAPRAGFTAGAEWNLVLARGFPPTILGNPEGGPRALALAVGPACR